MSGVADSGEEMARFVARRIAYMVITLALVSVVAFLIIQLPPGDYLTAYTAQLQNQGQTVSQAQLAALKSEYGLGQPVWIEYWKWITNILVHWNFGQSFELNRPVWGLIWSRLPMTITLGLCTLAFSWVISLPLGVYSAVRKYSLGDYTLTVLSFLGLAIPGFLLALVAMYIAFRYFGTTISGLFSPQFVNAEWNLGKVIDLIKHLWLPVVIIGAEGLAGTIRIMRANLMDELSKPYVVTARSKGLTERRLLVKYPLRIALNPFISTAGWVLPALVNGRSSWPRCWACRRPGRCCWRLCKIRTCIWPGGSSSSWPL